MHVYTYKYMYAMCYINSLCRDANFLLRDFLTQVSPVPPIWVAKKTINLIHAKLVVWNVSLLGVKHRIQLTKSFGIPYDGSFPYSLLSNMFSSLWLYFCTMFFPLSFLSPHHVGVKCFSAYRY